MLIRMQVALLLMLIASNLRGQAHPIDLSAAHIAVRSNDPRVLIIGGEVDTDEWAKLAAGGLKNLRNLSINSALSPGEATFGIDSKLFRKLAANNGNRFSLGDLWQIYPGSGPPVRVIVETLAFLYHGNGNQYLSAVARILRPADANRMSSLETEAYLALPGAPVKGISETPLVLIKSDYDNRKAAIGPRSQSGRQ